MENATAKKEQKENRPECQCEEEGNDEEGKMHSLRATLLLYFSSPSLARDETTRE